MVKPLHIALITSLLLGNTALSACSKKASEPTKKVEKVAPAPAKPVQKAEVKVAPKPAATPVKTAALSPVDAGKKVFTRCKACHTIDEGGKNRVGPNLHNIVGRESGTAANFKYSQAMMDSNIVWTEENLDQYLTKPKAFIPKNKMAFIGLKKEADRENLIAFLKANSGG